MKGDYTENIIGSSDYSLGKLKLDNARHRAALRMECRSLWGNHAGDLAAIAIYLLWEIAMREPRGSDPSAGSRC